MKFLIILYQLTPYVPVEGMAGTAAPDMIAGKFWPSFLNGQNIIAILVKDADTAFLTGIGYLNKKLSQNRMFMTSNHCHFLIANPLLNY